MRTNSDSVAAPQAGPSSAVSASVTKSQTESIARQYVVHEISQTADGPSPTWNSQMRALFGTHFDWENAKVYASAKNRPMCTSA